MSLGLCVKAGGGREFKVPLCHSVAEQDHRGTFSEVTGASVVLQTRWRSICLWIMFYLIILQNIRLNTHTHTQ